MYVYSKIFVVSVTNAKHHAVRFQAGYLTGTLLNYDGLILQLQLRSILAHVAYKSLI